MIIIYYQNNNYFDCEITTCSDEVTDVDNSNNNNPLTVFLKNVFSLNCEDNVGVILPLQFDTKSGQSDND